MNNKAVFLDRDGTLNEDKGYFHEADKLKLLPGVINGLKILSKKYKLLVISNQSGISKGIFSEKDSIKVNKKINEILKKYKIRIKKFYFCPHKKEDNCICRKPNPYLILKAAKENFIDLNKSWLIGDKTTDIQLGENIKKEGFLGFRTILVRTGFAGKDNKYNAKPDYVVKNIIQAAKIINN